MSDHMKTAPLYVRPVHPTGAAMEEQSDTPRTGVLVPSEELKRLQRERDEARAALRSIAEDSADKHSRECARSALAATEPKP